VKVSPKGSHIATRGDDSTVRIWDLEKGVCRQILRGYGSYVWDVAFSPQGDQIASGNWDKVVRLWNTETGACTHTLTGHSSSVVGVAYSPQGNQLASASEDMTVRLWDVGSGECSHILIGPTCMGRVMYSPNGNHVLSYSSHSFLRIWDAKTGVCNHTLIGHRDGVLLYRVAYSPQGDQIVSNEEDATVRVWDACTGECRQIFIGHEMRANTVAYSPKGNQIATGGNGPVKAWDTKAGTCLRTLTGHTETVKQVVYSSRGDVLVSASYDKSVRLWDVTSGQCRAMIQEYKSGVTDMAWIETSGINYLVVACEDRFVGMWQVKGDSDHCQVSLCWMPTKGELDVEDAVIQDAQGLGRLDKQLLTQRGAVGEPANRLREASKKVARMASVVSMLKATSDRVVPDTDVMVNVMVEQLQQRIEQVKDPLLHNILSVVVKDINEFL
jgi:WD40 repeat protein